MKILRYLALSLFSILIWIAATWYAVIDIDALAQGGTPMGGYYLSFIAFGIGLFCLFANIRLFNRGKRLAAAIPQKSVSFFTGLLGYVLLIIIAATVVTGVLSGIQILDIFVK